MHFGTLTHSQCSLLDLLPPLQRLPAAKRMGTGTGTLPTAFHELHSLPSLDPYDGNYMLPVSEFIIGTVCDHTAIFDKMVGVDPSAAVMSFVGFFLCPGETAGHSCLLHAPTVHPGCLGELTLFDGKVHAFSDDVESGAAPLVEFPEDAFEDIGPIQAHSKWEAFDLGVSSDWAKFSVMPTPAGQTHQLPKMIGVLPHHVSLLISHRLTPHQFCARVLDTVHHDPMFSAKAGVCWTSWCIMTCSIYDGGDNHSPILMDTNMVAPITNCWFLSCGQCLLCHYLPGLDLSSPHFVGVGFGGSGVPAAFAASRGLSSHVVALMMDLVKTQCDACVDAIVARAAMAQLLFLTGGASAANLPKVWLQIADGNSKHEREREMIEIFFHEATANTSEVDQAPVVTPDLAKKIITLHFADANMDNLSDGINPFLMVIHGHTSPNNENAYIASLSLRLATAMTSSLGPQPWTLQTSSLSELWSRSKSPPPAQWHGSCSRCMCLS